MIFAWPAAVRRRFLHGLAAIVVAGTGLAGSRTEAAAVRDAAQQPGQSNVAASRKRPPPAPVPARAPVRPPDILLITVDTLRPDRLPFGGCALNTAPFLDSLAATAVICARAYSVSSWTLPSLASLHTGLYPMSHGTTHGLFEGPEAPGQSTLPAAVPTLAELMRRKGYRTLAVVANSYLTPGWGFERGFERYLCVDFARPGVVNDSLRTLRSEIADESRPLFLWLHYFDPHHPYRVRQPWFAQLHPEIPHGNLQFAESVMDDWTNLPPMAQQHIGTLMTTARALYDSEIGATDEQIRAIWRDFPRLQRSFLVFTADHGEEFREHQSTTHGHNLFNTTVRIPMLLRPPGGGRPDTLSSVVSLIDLAPTLATLAGIRRPGNWPGSVIYRAGAAVPPPAERAVMAELDRNVNSSLLKAWIGPRWKLILDMKTRRPQLYDQLADPAELHDVAGDEPRQAELELRALKRCIAGLPVSPPMSPSRMKALSPELVEMLKSLGYLR